MKISQERPNVLRIECAGGTYAKRLGWFSLGLAPLLLLGIGSARPLSVLGRLAGFVGLLFAAGLVLNLRSVVTVDRGLGIVVFMRGVSRRMFAMSREQSRFTSPGVRLERGLAYTVDGPAWRVPVFPVWLAQQGRPTILIAYTRDEHRAREMASALADFLNTPLEDNAGSVGASAPRRWFDGLTIGPLQRVLPNLRSPSC